MNLSKYYFLAKKTLFPINRSITGDGIKKTLRIIKKEFNELKIHKIKSGTKVFDWKIPPEWNVDVAYVLDNKKKKIINFKRNNLHLIGYSQFKDKIITKNELLKHVYSLPENPKAIPYITSYYKKYWGFCVSNEDKIKIKRNYNDKDKFKIFINSKLKKNGYLNYGELLIKGKSKKEILISTYICHPSMANNELSGLIVCMSLINYFKKKKLEKSIRFLFIPETIGSIAYLNKNLKKLKRNVIGGYNITCVGDDRQHSCMFSKYNNSLSDVSLREAYKKLKIKFKEYSFLKRGSDERQYNSPGVDLGITSIFRTKYGEYPEYHTSLDNFKLVTKKGLIGGYNVAKKTIEILQKKIIPINKILCEPNMGKRKLYPLLSFAQKKNYGQTKDLMNFLTYADGKNDLDTISKYIKKNYSAVKKIHNLLKNKKLISE